MKKFKRIYIEITNVCNLNCSFCPVTKRDNRFLSTEEFLIILDKIKGYTDYIYFHVKGEPLMHPNLLDFFKLSEEKGYKVNITTNGTLIDKHLNSFIEKNLIRQISFSLQSYENNSIYDFEKYIANIMYFIKEAIKKTDMYIELRLWNLSNDQFKTNTSSLNKHILDSISTSLNLPFNITEKISPSKGVKLIDKVFLSQQSEFQWPDMSIEDISSTGFCYGLSQQIAILSNGTVVPCCLDHEGNINLGNIFNEDFEDIINSNRAREMLLGFRDNILVESLCRKCGYRERFDTK